MISDVFGDLQNWFNPKPCGFQGKGIFLYVDAELETEMKPPVRGLNGEPLALGGSWRGNRFENAHRWMMDELIFWDRPLSKKEVQQIYQAQGGHGDAPFR